MAKLLPKIRAMDGSALVEGKLALLGQGPLAAALPRSGAGDLVGVGLGGGRRPSLGLYRQWRRAADGLYAAGRPEIDIRFGEAMPDLRALASSPAGARGHAFTLRSGGTAPGTRLLTLWFRPGAPDVLPVHAHLDEIRLEVGQVERGLAIRLEGDLLPVPLAEGGRLLEGVRLECEVVLPMAYAHLNSLALLWPGWDRHEEWSGESATLESMPISAAAFSRGTVDWGQDPEGHQCRGPFAQAWLSEDGLSLRPARRVWETTEGKGFAELDADGPEVQLGFGRSLLASLIERDERAEVSFRTGIGHLDGQTGRSVGECGGPMRQAIRRLDLQVERHQDALRLSGEGEVEPLPPSLASVARSLGPRLRFDFTFSRTWLLARGMRLPRFWEDWKRELGTNDLW